jgi:flagellar motor switch protein FliN
MSEETIAPPEPQSDAVAPPQPSSDEGNAPATLGDLHPSYAQNLLTIEVPVSVTLALKKQPLAQIVELAPGSIIQFEKSCEEMLELCVGDHCVARGLAVKVGEKFGLRINQLTGPKERFQSFRPES